MYLSQTRRVVGIQRLTLFRFVRVQSCVEKRNRLKMKTTDEFECRKKPSIDTNLYRTSDDCTVSNSDRLTAA